MHYYSIQFVRRFIMHRINILVNHTRLLLKLTLSGRNFILPAGHLEKARINVREDVGCTFCRAEYSLQYLRQSVFRLVSDRFQHIVPQKIGAWKQEGSEFSEGTKYYVLASFISLFSRDNVDSINDRLAWRSLSPWLSLTSSKRCLMISLKPFTRHWQTRARVYNEPAARDRWSLYCPWKSVAQIIYLFLTM